MSKSEADEFAWAATVLAGHAPVETGKLMMAVACNSPVLHAHLKRAINEASAVAGQLESETEDTKNRLSALLSRLENRCG